MSFNIGDRVKIINHVTPVLTKGLQGTVTSLDVEQSFDCMVKFDGISYNPTSSGHSMLFKELELISMPMNIVIELPTIKAGPVNDYVCPTCKNTRCSKSEIKCWLCGNLL